MDSFSDVALIVLVLIVFGNYRNGTLGAWLGAKFLNRRDVAGLAGDAAGGVAAGAGSGAVTPAAYGDVTHQVTKSLLAPVGNAPITSPFGVDRGDHNHAGVDYGVPTGTQVHAAGGGRVTFAGPKGGYGNTVDVDHGLGVVTRYGHLSTISVRVGQGVQRGDVLGLSGATGDATGPHLHFEVRLFGVPVNPLDWLRPLLADAGIDVGKATQVFA